MTLRFSSILPITALFLQAATCAFAQEGGGCEPRQKRFGIVLDSMAPAGTMRIAIVASGWGGSAAGLKPGDEILDVNAQQGPPTGIAAQTAFLNSQPLAANAFRVRRGGVVTTLNVEKTCPPATNGAAMAEFRAKLLQLVAEQQKHFTGVTGSRDLPEETIGKSVAKESTIHLFKDDKPMIKVDPKPEFSYYFNRLRGGMTEPVSARLFAIWSKTISEALPEYQSTTKSSTYGIANRVVFTKGSAPDAGITLTRTESDGVYTVSVTISTTKEAPLDLGDLLD